MPICWAHARDSPKVLSICQAYFLHRSIFVLWLSEKACVTHMSRISLAKVLAQGYKILTYPESSGVAHLVIPLGLFSTPPGTDASVGTVETLLIITTLSILY